MAADYRTFAKCGFSEVVEKKSRFLGEALPVKDAAEAEEYIAQVRKRHYDARHHCFAYVAGEPGTPEEVTRFSDDGEPSGTAGKPILEILAGRQLHHVLIVVTRYFGGTLLGTGGLVRAYGAAAREAADDAGILSVRQGTRLRISCSYPAYGKLQYLFAKEGIQVESTEFAEGVVIGVLVQKGGEERMRKLVAELTDGAGLLEEAGDVCF